MIREYGARIAVYCLLEVRTEDKEDGVLLAAMLLDGNTIAESVQPEVWFRTYLGYEPVGYTPSAGRGDP